MSHRAQAAAKAARDTKKLTSDEAMSLEEARGRVFRLEEALSGLRRKADVELSSEVAQLKHQVPPCAFCYVFHT